MAALFRGPIDRANWPLGQWPNCPLLPQGQAMAAYSSTNEINPPMPATQLMVHTRRGPVHFTTSLEWEGAIALCQEEARKGNKFAYDLCLREEKNLYMSSAQVSWVYKIAEDALQLSNVQSEPKAPRETDASNILASLAEARAKGLKKPTLRLKGAGGVEIRLKYMSVGRNAGGAWVTQRVDGVDELIGKVGDDGVFTFTAKGHSTSLIDEVFSIIEQANANPRAALESYGRVTSTCGCCGLPLTNAASIALGIGPICLEKYGL